MLPHDIYLIGCVCTPGDICLTFDIYFKSKIDSNFKPLYFEGFIKSYLFLDFYIYFMPYDFNGQKQRIEMNKTVYLDYSLMTLNRKLKQTHENETLV